MKNKKIEPVDSVRVIDGWRVQTAPFDSFRIIRMTPCRCNYNSIYRGLRKIRMETEIPFFPEIKGFPSEKYADLIVRADNSAAVTERIRKTFPEASIHVFTAGEYIHDRCFSDEISGFQILMQLAIGYSYTIDCLPSELPAGKILLAMPGSGSREVPCIGMGTEIIEGAEPRIRPKMEVIGGKYRKLEKSEHQDEDTTHIFADGVIGRGGSGTAVRIMKKPSGYGKKTRTMVSAESFTKRYKSSRSWYLRDMLRRMEQAGFEKLTIDSITFRTNAEWWKEDGKRILHERAAVEKILQKDKVRICSPENKMMEKKARRTLARALKAEYCLKLGKNKMIELFGLERGEDLIGSLLEVRCVKKGADLFITGIKDADKVDPRADQLADNDVAVFLKRNERDTSGIPSGIMIHLFYPEAVREGIEVELALNEQRPVTVNLRYRKNVKKQFHIDEDSCLAEDGLLTLSIVPEKEEDVHHLYDAALSITAQHMTEDNVDNINAMKACLEELAIRDDICHGKITLVPETDLIPGIYYTAYSQKEIYRMEMRPDGTVNFRETGIADLRNDVPELCENLKEVTRKQRAGRSSDQQEDQAEAQSREDAAGKDGDEAGAKISQSEVWRGMLIGNRPYALTCTMRQMIPYSGRSLESYRSRSMAVWTEYGAELGLCWRYGETDLEYSSGYLTGDNRQEFSGYPNLYCIHPLDERKAEITPEQLHSWLFSGIVRKAQNSSTLPYPYKYLGMWANVMHRIRENEKQEKRERQEKQERQE